MLLVDASNQLISLLKMLDLFIQLLLASAHVPIGEALSQGKLFERLLKHGLIPMLIKIRKHSCSHWRALSRCRHYSLLSQFLSYELLQDTQLMVVT